MCGEVMWGQREGVVNQGPGCVHPRSIGAIYFPKLVRSMEFEEYMVESRCHMQTICFARGLDVETWRLERGVEDTSVVCCEYCWLIECGEGYLRKGNIDLKYEIQ